MRILLLAFISSCLCCPQQLELPCRLRAPGNWKLWVLSPSAEEAIRNYSISDDRDARLLIEDKIRKGQYVTYKTGDEAIFIEESGAGDAWRIKIVNGENLGREGWIHWSLGEMTKESKARLASAEERERIPEETKRAAEVGAKQRKRTVGALEGTILDQDGHPVRGARVNIDRTDDRGRYTVTADKGGHFMHGGLPVGNYNVTAFGPGHRLVKQINDVRLDGGQVQNLDFGLQAPHGLAQPQSVPIPSASYTIPLGIAGGVVVEYQITTVVTYGRMFQNKISGRLTNTTNLPIACAGIDPVVPGTPATLLGVNGVRLASGASRSFSQNDMISVTNVSATGISAWKGVSCMTPLDYGFVRRTDTKGFSGGVVTGSIRTNQIGITVENSSDQPIEIDWNGSSFIDTTRSAKRIFHSGVKYTDREQSLPNTTVPPLAKVEEAAIPTANVYYSEGSTGGWREEPLLPTMIRPDLAETAMRTLKGAKVALFLQLLVTGKKTPVTLTFEVSDVRPGSFN
jgi:Carboxypeptidase regulatory-like domain